MITDDVFVQGGQPLLDGVRIDFGPRALLCRFFLIAEELGRQAGVDIQVHSDLATLVEANSKLQASWGPLVPTYSPAENDLIPDTTFWLSAHNSSGGVVATCAARRFDVGEAGFGDEFTSLRVFYSEPGHHLAKGTTCTIDGDARISGKLIRGTVNYTGAHWARPDYRGRGLVYLFSRISRCLGVARWDSDFTVGVTRVDLLAKQALGSYGYRNSDQLIQVRNSYRGDFELSLVWMDRAWMDQELIGYVAEQDAKLARVAEADDTMTP